MSKTKNIFEVNETMRIIGAQPGAVESSSEGKAVIDILTALNLPMDSPYFECVIYGMTYGKYIGRHNKRKELDTWQD